MNIQMQLTITIVPLYIFFGIGGEARKKFQHQEGSLPIVLRYSIVLEPSKAPLPLTTYHFSTYHFTTLNTSTLVSHYAMSSHYAQDIGLSIV